MNLERKGRFSNLISVSLKRTSHYLYFSLFLSLIGLEWDSINLFTKMNFFSSKTHISAEAANRICKWGRQTQG